jgi:hypothetical protein
MMLCFLSYYVRCFLISTFSSPGGAVYGFAVPPVLVFLFPEIDTVPGLWALEANIKPICTWLEETTAPR